MSTLTKANLSRASQVAFTDSTLEVQPVDGRHINLPLEWFPKLRDASAEARAD